MDAYPYIQYIYMWFASVVQVQSSQFEWRNTELVNRNVVSRLLFHFRLLASVCSFSVVIVAAVVRLSQRHAAIPSILLVAGERRSRRLPFHLSMARDGFRRLNVVVFAIIISMWSAASTRPARAAGWLVRSSRATASLDRLFTSHTSTRRQCASSSSSCPRTTRTWFSTRSASEPQDPPQQQQNPPFHTTFDEFAQLAADIRRHDALYYNDPSNLELVSDEAFDALVELEAQLCISYPQYLERLEDELGTKDATRYGGRVGSGSTTLTTTNTTTTNTTTDHTTFTTPAKLAHLVPMLSLDNVHNTGQLQHWLGRIQKHLYNNNNNNTKTTTIQLVTEPKLDGLSLSLRYQRRDSTTAFDFQWAATRGDGHKGQNVTVAALEALHDMPRVLEWSGSASGSASASARNNVTALEVRGEVVLPLSHFHKNNVLECNFSNARNAASGILLRKPNHSKRQSNNDDDDKGQDEKTTRLRSLLGFYAYDIVLVADADTAVGDANAAGMERMRGLENGVATRGLLDHWGFRVPKPVLVTDLDLAAVTGNGQEDQGNDKDKDKDDLIQIPQPLMDYYNALMQHRLGEHSNSSSELSFQWEDYDMDGAVHKVSSAHLRRELGASNRSPRWAVAHKFPPQATVTSLLDMEVQVGRTGALTPVAILEPVDLGGVSVRRATLHNFRHMQQVLGGKGERVEAVPQGARVLVRRAGDVIPQVVQRVLEDVSSSENGEASRTAPLISLKTPLHCPACGSDTVVDEPSNSTTSIGQVVRCGGPSLLCRPRAVGALAHAFSRDALDVTGLSEARIQQLLDEGILRRPSDLFRLVASSDRTTAQKLIDQIAELPGWGPKSAGNLAASAERIAEDGISLGRFIFSLNIRHVGQFSSNLIASTYGSALDFLEAVKAASQSDEAVEESTAFPLLIGDGVLEGTKGIGPVLVSSLLAFSKQPELVRAAEDLVKVVLVHEEKRLVEKDKSVLTESEEGLPWKGLTIVFTGGIPDMTRKQAHDVAKEMGAKGTPSSVSKSTDIVVIGDKGGKKLETAIKLGIRVMESSEFLSLSENFRAEKAQR